MVLASVAADVLGVTLKKVTLRHERIIPTDTQSHDFGNWTQQLPSKVASIAASDTASAQNEDPASEKDGGKDDVDEGKGALALASPLPLDEVGDRLSVEESAGLADNAEDQRSFAQAQDPEEVPHIIQGGDERAEGSGSQTHLSDVLPSLAPVPVDATLPPVTAPSAQPSRVDAQFVVLHSTTKSRSDPKHRVVHMLRMLQENIRKEGKLEEVLFNNHMCACNKEGATLKVAINGAEEKVPQLQFDIKETASSMATAKETVQQQMGELQDADAALQEAKSLRNQENAEFEKLSNELVTNIGALNKAIVGLSTGQPGLFLQTKEAALLRKFSTDSTLEDLDEDGRSKEVLTAFLEGKEADLEEVLGVLKQIAESMGNELADAKVKEEQAVKTFASLQNAKMSGMAAAQQLMNGAERELGSLKSRSARLQDELEGTVMSLKDNQALLKELEKSCMDVKEEWFKRQRIRSDELLASREAIEILSGDTFDGSMRVASGFMAPHFLQVASQMVHARRPNPARSSRTTLPASPGRPAINFHAVLKLVDSTLATLDKAQVADDREYSYCTKEITRTETEKADLLQAIQDLGTAEAEKEGTLRALVHDIAELVAGIKAQDQKAADVTAQRQAEHAEHVSMLAENRKALELIEMARLRLAQIYDSPNAKLLQASGDPAHGPKLDASPEQVLGQGPENSGRAKVLNMIQEIEADLAHEGEEARAAERAAQADYEELMRLAKARRATDAKRLIEREASRADAEVRLHGIRLNKGKNQERNKLVMNFLVDLHTRCDQLLANYKLHQAGRIGEAEALEAARRALEAEGMSTASASASEPTGGRSRDRDSLSH